ncbi:hypothetical protein FAIPA1_310007 [Frankia sp. AiPs1]
MAGPVRPRSPRGRPDRPDPRRRGRCRFHRGAARARGGGPGDRYRAGGRQGHRTRPGRRHVPRSAVRSTGGCRRGRRGVRRDRRRRPRPLGRSGARRRHARHHRRATQGPTPGRANCLLRRRTRSRPARGSRPASPGRSPQADRRGRAGTPGSARGVRSRPAHPRQDDHQGRGRPEVVMISCARCPTWRASRWGSGRRRRAAGPEPDVGRAQRRVRRQIRPGPFHRLALVHQSGGSGHFPREDWEHHSRAHVSDLRATHARRRGDEDVESLVADLLPRARRSPAAGPNTRSGSAAPTTSGSSTTPWTTSVSTPSTSRWTMTVSVARRDRVGLELPMVGGSDNLPL